MALRVLGELVPQTTGMIVSLGLPLFHQNALYDAACMAVDGKIVGFTAKRYLAGDGNSLRAALGSSLGRPAGERKSMSMASNIRSATFTTTAAASASVSKSAKTPGQPTGLGVELSQQSVDIILNPSASHFAFGKIAVRERFVLEGSRAFGVHYIYSNLLGNEAGRAIYDGGGQ